MKRTFSVAWMGLWLLLSDALMATGHAANPSDYRITALAIDPVRPTTEQHIKNVVVEGNTIENITINISEVTAVGEKVDLSAVPRTFALYQSYPNPFNVQTRIGYALPKACKVDLTIYNVLGQKVKTLVDEPQGAGRYTVGWDGTDEGGRSVAGGMYGIRLEAGEAVAVRKALLLR